MRMVQATVQVLACVCLVSSRMLDQRAKNVLGSPSRHMHHARTCVNSRIGEKTLPIGLKISAHWSFLKQKTM